MSSKVRYHDLRTSAEDDEDEFTLPHLRSEKPLPEHRKTVILALSALCALLLYTAFILAIPPTLDAINAHTHPFNHTDLTHGSCGSSPQEAEALGCHFDIMYWGWVHPNCHNATESALWEAAYGPWVWKKRLPSGDPLLNDDVPRAALAYETAVFATDHYHWAHCLYAWKMVHMAAVQGGMVSPEVGPVRHTEHCIERIKEYDPAKRDAYRTDVRNYYGVCYRMRE